jgi:hypothetical protein
MHAAANLHNCQCGRCGDTQVYPLSRMVKIVTAQGVEYIHIDHYIEIYGDIPIDLRLKQRNTAVQSALLILVVSGALYLLRIRYG